MRYCNSFFNLVQISIQVPWLEICFFLSGLFRFVDLCRRYRLYRRLPEWSSCYKKKQVTSLDRNHDLITYLHKPRTLLWAVRAGAGFIGPKYTEWSVQLIHLHFFVLILWFKYICRKAERKASASFLRRSSERTAFHFLFQLGLHVSWHGLSLALHAGDAGLTVTGLQLQGQRAKRKYQREKGQKWQTTEAVCRSSRLLHCPTDVQALKKVQHSAEPSRQPPGCGYEAFECTSKC